VSTNKLTIAIGSDHAGFRYKSLIIEMLREAGHTVRDYGTSSTESVDYPLFIRPVALAVAAGEFDRGIVLGGSGNGEAIVANRVSGVRCTLCWNVESARLGRAHNNANVLSLGERMVSEDEMRAIVNEWLSAPFEGGRHERRIREIDNPESAAEISRE
jgi:ribose 5-phosphate isomerase B